MKRNNIIGSVLAAGLVGYVVLNQTGFEPSSVFPKEPVTPDWAAIAAWPDLDLPGVEVKPDPNRRVTVIVLDDSGSMSADISAAKQAVVDALGPMDDTDRVSVVALNAGVVLPFSSVQDARTTLPREIQSISSDGSTPLTNAILQARSLLEEEASAMRSYGTFRIIVTTDGEADDSNALDSAIVALATTTPVQLTTIGIGINGGHVLRRSDLGAFVDVKNVEALESALQAAVAENTDFESITDFSTVEN